MRGRVARENRPPLARRVLMADSREPVRPEAYDKDYFLTECQGHDAYIASQGRVLPERLSEALSLAGDLAGTRVLDMGCGRGEVVCRGVDQGAFMVGLDYSPDALDLARGIVPAERALLVRADASHLPFVDRSFDRVLAFDLVEHLLPRELQAMYAEIYRVLAPGGRFVVHTMPNVWYYRYGYPLYRVVQRLRGRRLPRDPRDRWRFVKNVHVNEQSIAMLGRELRRAGFDVRVHLRNVQAYDQEARPLVRGVMRALSSWYPFSLVFCNDLFAVAKK